MEKKGYGMGILGAIIGGVIAAIPWLLIYVYGNTITSVLAILIAIGALKGYQIAKGKEDKKLAIIIAVVSIVIVTVSNLVVAPLMMLADNGFDVSFHNLQVLYDNAEFMGALMHDFIISIIFTIVGISGVVANINKQVKAGEKITGLNTVTVSDEVVASYREAFAKLGALSKETAVEQINVLDLVDVEYHNDFQNLLNNRMIRKYKGKYYFVESK